MNDTKVTYSSGLSFATLLAVAFIVLKLGGWTQVATWSWWWVLSPIWIPLAFVILICLGTVIFARIMGKIKSLL